MYNQNIVINGLPPAMEAAPGEWLSSVIEDSGLVARGEDLVESRVDQIAESYVALKHVFAGKSVDVSLTLFEPSRHAAYIRVSGYELEFKDGALLAAIGRMATNVDLGLQTDDIVYFELMFYGMIEGGELNG